MDETCEDRGAIWPSVSVVALAGLARESAAAFGLTLPGLVEPAGAAAVV